MIGSYAAIHVVAITAIFFLPFTWAILIQFVITYFTLMFFITAGYHRYFSHRAYQLGRVPQFILAWLCQASAQKGVLWWAANHRHHHVHSDTDLDIHSPVKRGFWYSHIGWVFDPATFGYNEKTVKDLSSFPELRFINKYHYLPTISFALVVFLVGGFTYPGTEGFVFGAFRGLVWGYALVLLCTYQVSYCVNSLAHVFGSKRFETGDESRNNWFLAILTNGEGWHNNHHYCKGAARQGIRWYEIDMTYYVIYVFSLLGIVKNIRPFREENRGIVVEGKQE